jgi:hypothetical protein
MLTCRPSPREYRRRAAFWPRQARDARIAGTTPRRQAPRASARRGGEASAAPRRTRGAQARRTADLASPYAGSKDLGEREHRSREGVQSLGKAAKISRLRQVKRVFAHWALERRSLVKCKMKRGRKKHPSSPNLPIVTSGCRPTLKRPLGCCIARRNQKFCHD